MANFNIKVPNQSGNSGKSKVEFRKVARRCPHCGMVYYEKEACLRREMPVGKLCKNVFEDDK